MGRTVLVVDDHAAFRASAARLLAAAGFTVVAEAADAATGLLAAAAVHPDVVLLDVQLPDNDGFSVARQLAVDLPETAVVLTSSRDLSSYRLRVKDSGARGFIGKADLSEESLVALVGAA